MELQHDATLPESGAPPSAASPPIVTWPDPGQPPPDHLTAMACPSCASTRAKELVLSVEGGPADQKSHTLFLLRCPDCTSLFYSDLQTRDNVEPDFNKRGWVAFHIQQGAGISVITRPLARVQKPADSAFLEVGCGYGFGLDFAIRTRGWRGVGFDPAPLSALGREDLQVPIELRYLNENEESLGAMDVVMASDVIEHVTSPRAFVKTLRAMLQSDGVLIVTTPNANHVVPTTSPSVLLPLLSPGQRLVLQSPASLRALLTEAGFAHVVVEIDSHSLVAFASSAPFALETDQTQLGLIYRQHLLRRASEVSRTSDLFIRFAGGAFFECVNAGDRLGAQQAWELLVPACRERYRFDLTKIDALPPATTTCGLEEMARLMPLNLSLILYADAMLRLSSGTPRRQVERRFVLAAAAAKATRRALAELSMEDGLTEVIGWVSASEALLCAAQRGSFDLLTRLHALPVAPSGAGGDIRRREIGELVLTSLVNSRHYLVAREVARTEGLLSGPLPDAPIRDATRDALFSLGVLDIQSGGNSARARDRFAFVRKSTEVNNPLFWSSIRGEIQALTNMRRPHEATALVKEVVSAGQIAQSDIPEDIRKKLR